MQAHRKRSGEVARLPVKLVPLLSLGVLASVRDRRTPTWVPSSFEQRLLPNRDAANESATRLGERMRRFAKVLDRAWRFVKQHAPASSNRMNAAIRGNGPPV